MACQALSQLGGRPGSVSVFSASGCLGFESFSKVKILRFESLTPLRSVSDFSHSFKDHVASDFGQSSQDVRS